MKSKLLAIEERVPGPDGAIRLYVPGEAHGAEALRRPYRSRFVQALADAIAARDRRPSLLVGPSRRVARQWIDTIARTGMPVFNVHTATPQSLCYNLAADGLAVAGLAVASPQMGVNLVEKVLREAIAGGRLHYFPQPPSFRRLAERMLATLSAMRMAGLDSEMVLAKKPFGQSPKAHDLACLLDAYEAQLKAENLADAAIVASMARMAADDERVPFDWDTILVPKGLDVRPLESRVFLSLGTRVQELPIDDAPLSFTDRAKAPALHFTRAIGEANEIRGFLRCCIKEGIRLDQVELLHTDDATYPAIVQDLLAIMPGGDGDDLPVTFAEGLSVRGATPARALAAWLDWRAAKRPQWKLARMLSDGLLAWRRFVPETAVVPDTKASSPPEPNDVPGPGRPAAAPGTALPSDDVTRAGLIRQLRRLTLDLDKDPSVATIRAAITSVEQAPLSTFVPHGRKDDDDTEVDEAVARKIKSDRLRTLSVLAAIVDGFLDCEPPADAKAGDVLRGARDFLENVAASHSQYDNNAKNRFLAEFAERESWLQKHPDTPANEIIEWLRSLCDRLVVMGSGPRPGRMHVASITSGGHSGRPVTFIVGLDEGRFPRAHSVDPVLPDHDRVRLSDALETSSQAAAKSRSDFWNLLGRLRGEVWLSYSCRDLVEQAEGFPSPLVLDAYGRHLAREAITLKAFLNEVGKSTDAFVTSDPACALTPSDWWLAQFGRNPSLETVRRAMEHCRPGLAHGETAAEARRSADFTEWDGLVPDSGPALDPSNPGGRPASAHSLETLGACPRRFFFSYGLGVEVLDTGEPDGDQWLNPLERGSVMHAVLERFMRRFLPDAANPPAGALHPVFDRDEQELEGILAEALAENRAVKPTDDEGEFERQRRELSHALGMFLKAEEQHCTTNGARPIALEAAIGVAPKESVTPLDHEDPVVLKVSDNRDVQMRGYVDRVDQQQGPAAPHEYSIVDYKSGSSTRFKKGAAVEPLAAFDSGRRLQHGLYVLMVRHVVRDKIDEHGTVDTFTYMFPNAGGERVSWTAKELEGVTIIVDRLCGIVGAGAFVATNKKDDCSYCDYLDVCGKPVKTVATANRKLADENLARLFAGLREAKAETSRPSPITRPHPLNFSTTAEPAPGAAGDAAARASIRTDLGTSFAVHASAGTGKTACLVDRMIALVQTGTATVRQIAAITFTKKAAAELSRRFREELQSAAAKTADVSERERFLAAIADIDSAVIGTVHAFCDRLLRERPIEAGLDPSFELLDAAAEESLLHRAWREFRVLAIHDPTLGPLRRDLEASGMKFQDLWSAFRTLVTHADVKSWPTDDVRSPDMKQLVGDVCKEIAARLPDCRPPAPERGTDELMNALEATLLAYHNRPNDDTATLMKVAASFAGRCKKIVQKVWWPDADAKQKKANAAALENWWTQTQDRFREPLRQCQAYRYRLAIHLLLAARDHYDGVRAACGVLSFSDLLCRTAALLREKPDVRMDLAERYPFLLVDEFQDTDPLQAEIMLLLTADDPKATDWRTAKVKPGSLFVVGDPQQSIYRFRRANIEVFEFVKDRIVTSDGCAIHLTTNFRTNSTLVDWVNTQFAGRFAQLRKDHGLCVPQFKPSTSGRSTGSVGMLWGFRQLRIEGTDVSAEAEAVASFIRRAIDNKLTVPRTEEETTEGIPPECRAEDFMIVTGDTGNLSTYANALLAVDLPCDVTGRKGPDSEDDLRTLRLCLKAIADPDDPVAALAVLRSPVFGFSDAELYAFHSAGGKIRGWLHVPETLPSKLQKRYATAAQALRLWIGMAGSLPLPAAVEAIADQAGLLLIASAADGEAGRRGRAGAGAIMTFIERVRAERHLLNSVQDVVARIDDLVCPEFPKQDFDTTSLDAIAGGAVRVMNLHKVKGLEAPVVFLCDTDGSGEVRDPSWHVSRAPGAVPEGRLIITRSTNSYGTARLNLAMPLDWDTHEASERSHLHAENLRKQYVAGTRPGCCLIASVFTKKDGTANGGWHELAPNVTTFDDLPDLPQVPAAAEETDELPDDAAIAAEIDAAAAAAKAIHQPTYGTVTPRDFLTESAERLRHSGDGLGEAWGTVIHLLLESALRNEQSPQPAFNLAAIATSALAESELSESGLDLAMLADRAVELVEEVRQSPLWKRIQAGGECYMEVPFSICVDAAEVGPKVPVDYGPVCDGLDPIATDEEQPPPSRPPVLIRGQIDLTFRDASATPAESMTDWFVVDWKTSAVVAADKQKLIDSYRPQITLYARCWAVREIPTPDLHE